jgi:hypothetical protein
MIEAAETGELDGIVFYHTTLGPEDERWWLEDLEEYLNYIGLSMPPTLVETGYYVSPQFTEYLNEHLPLE